MRESAPPEVIDTDDPAALPAIRGVPDEVSYNWVELPMSATALAAVRAVPEQQRALELFASGGNLRIDAYAGSGKTTTLAMLAASRPGRATYLAFNRSIAMEARSRFPDHVQCSTAHAIAFRAVSRQLRYPEWKLTGKLTANLVADAFRLPASVSFRCGVVLDRRTYAAVLAEGLKRFLRTSEHRPQPGHVPCNGMLAKLSAQQFESFAEQAASHLEHLWAGMLDRAQPLPLGHDGYLKLWALSQPEAKADYIMVDEAQDLNLVLLEVLNRTACQIVYVGDPYQQIYEWRGAVNAMEQVHTQHRALLSQSFRFGPEIAAAASIVLRNLGACEPLRGSADRVSHIARVRPDAILARTNAGVITNVLHCLGKGIRCGVVGGTHELERVLEDVQRIKQGAQARSAELLGFQSWRAVMSFSAQAEGESLKGLVNLVQEHGEDYMLRSLAGCERNEENAQVVCSTAHRAKGREWNHVHLNPDFESGFKRAGRLSDKEARETVTAEARLLYVAMTRARLAVHLPREIGRRFGIKKTTDEVLGS